MSFTPFSADELATMRAAVVGSFTDLCSSTREVESGPTDGPPTITPTAILTNVACRLRIASVTMRAQEGFNPTGRMEDAQLWLVFLPIGTNVLLNDLLTVNGHTLRVMATNGAKTNALSLVTLTTEYTY
jgi:hypothetical protein